MTTEPNTNTLNELLENLAGLLQQKGETLSTAESCTGGMVASELVGLPGASVFFQRRSLYILERRETGHSWRSPRYFR